MRGLCWGARLDASMYATQNTLHALSLLDPEQMYTTTGLAVSESIRGKKADKWAFAMPPVDMSMPCFALPAGGKTVLLNTT